MRKSFIDQLVELPLEIIHSIFSNIPDRYLHTYIDNPLIGTYALDTLFSKVTIESNDTEHYWGPPDIHIPIGDELDILNAYFAPGLPEVHEIRFEHVYHFLDFLDKYPNSNPKIISFNDLNEVLAAHKAHPNKLKVADIQVRNLYSDRSEEGILNLPYKFLKLGYTEHRDYGFPTTVRDVELLHTTLLIFPGYYDDLQTLRIPHYGLKADELRYIPPKLQSLSMALILEDSPREVKLPISLSSLELEFIIDVRFFPFDLSYLVNLKSFTSLQNSISLSSVSLPKLITSLSIYTDDIQPDTFTQFSNLRRLKIHTVYGEMVYGIPFPESLLLLFIEGAYLEYRLPQDVEVGKDFLLPPNLKFLKVDGNQFVFAPEDMELPPSLEYLKLRGYGEQLDWPFLKLPSHILKVSISQQDIESLNLPRTVTTLKLTACTLYSLDYFNFEKLISLVKVSIRDTRIGYIDCRFGPSLNYLSFAGSYILRILIVAPNLKILDLSCHNIDSAYPFKMPDSVIYFRMNGYMKGGSPFDPRQTVEGSNMVLSKSLRNLTAEAANLTSETLKKWNLRSRCKHLEIVNLGRNLITKIDSHFPPSLRILDLSSNKIIIPNLRFFKGFKQLEVLRIGDVALDNYLTGRYCLEFPDSLVELDLRGNGLDNKSFKHMKLSNCKGLRFINLTRNPNCDIVTIITGLQETCPLLSRLSYRE